MAITIYQCSSCHRTTELQQLHQTVSFTSKCIITNHCAGQLLKIGQRYPGVIGKSTPVVDGLADYNSKDRLYTHDQTLSTSKWLITHKLRTNPLVQIYIRSVSATNINGYEKLDPDLYFIDIIDENTIHVEFADDYIGKAQLIAQSTGNVSTEVISSQEEFVQCSSNNILTIATPIFPTDIEEVPITVSYFHPSTSKQVDHQVTFAAHKYGSTISLFNTPWSNVELITWNSNTYRVRSIRINTLRSNIGSPQGIPIFFPNNPNLVILLSNTPYQNIVDIDARVVRGSDVIGITTNNYTTDQEMFVEGTLPIMYPPGVKVAKLITEV